MRSSAVKGFPLIVWALISPFRLLGVSLLLGYLLPLWLTLPAFTLLTLIPSLTAVLRHLHLLPTPPSPTPSSYPSLPHPRTTSVIRGDFVVFLIGARINSPLPLTPHSIAVASAFTQMLTQLEASDPDTTGFLGADPYVGAHPDRSTTLSVQYWRSYEHLHRWARAKGSQHLAIWKAFNGRGGERGYGGEGGGSGIWHETYLVRDGEYEAVYSGMPPMGLALATGNVQAAVGAMKTSAGRVKGKQHLDTPPEGADENYHHTDAQSTASSSSTNKVDREPASR